MRTAIRRISLLSLSTITLGAATCPGGEEVVEALEAMVENQVIVMTFNIHHDVDNWSGSRRDLVVRAIEREEADVVGLQEAYLSQVEWLVEQMPQYGWVGEGRNANGSGESVSILFNKERFSVDDDDTFWFSNRPDVAGTKPGSAWGNPTLPRICTWVRLVQRSTGEAFYVYNVHLQHNAGDDPELARVRSVMLLTSRIEARSPQDPYVVTGDFNASPTQVPIRYLTEGNTHTVEYCPESGGWACHQLQHQVPMIDSWAEHNPNSTRGTRCDGGAGSGSRIDYVFADPVGTVLGAMFGFKVSGACPSDHSPVIAGLLLPLAGGQ